MEDNDQPTQVTSTAIHAITVMLPTFSPNELLTWFRRAETHFRLKDVTRTGTKSDYVLEALPESVFRRLSSWLDDQGDTIPYDDLKQQLLKEYSPLPSERARRVLEMPQQPLGDRTSRQVWNEIVSLCRLQILDPATNKYKEIDLKKEIWLATLPSNIRALLHDTDADSMENLITRADALIETHKICRPSPVPSVASAEPNGAECDDELNAIYRPPTRTTPRRTQYYTPRRGPFQAPPFQATITPAGICSYHDRFKNNAGNCMEGCKYWKPKNSQGGRS